jgi:predicted N-acetyltransferase YhbS
VRNVPFAEKQAVYAEYGITSHQPGQYEVDHLISLELGGSNSVQNLWPEAAEPRPGFHEKDQVENYLHQLVCSGRLDLETAQAEIRDDWLQVYVAMTVPNATPLPSPQPTVDNGAGVAAMNIRPERVTDYAAIADVNARAFGNRASEPAIVALHRQRVAFDPELSLVAEAEGRVVGHALFSPRTVRLLGRDVPAVSLAPIAVLPEAQRQGIGGRLIEEGHRVARTKGFPFSFLIGHADYYPRFGYEQHAYGFSRVTVPVRELPAGSLEERAPAPHDLSGLQELWRRAEGPVDFTLAPDIDLLAWVSPNPAVESIVFRRDGEIVGYSRVSALEPEKPRVFLARDAETARLVAGALARRAGAGSTELVLPLHPASPAAAAFPAPSLQTSKAAMAAPLSPSPLDEYLAQVRVGKRLPGHVIWPVEFDL